MENFSTAAVVIPLCYWEIPMFLKLIYQGTNSRLQ